MSKNNVKTIEELFISKTGNDLWDEFNQSSNPNTMTLYIPSNQDIKLRFLGPFINTKRFYAPSLKQIDDIIDIGKIADKNTEEIEKAKQALLKIENKKLRYQITKDTAEAMRFLNEIHNKATWQQCILVNVYVKSGLSAGHDKIRVFTITKKLCDSLLGYAPKNDPNVVLNGIVARDVTIKKLGEGLLTNFEVKYDKVSSLSDAEINHILALGLIDIPNLINELNKYPTSSYHYKISNNYRMQSEFAKTIFEDIARIEENKHFNDVEEHLDEIPIEAFEKRNNVRNAIGSLEL